MSGPALTLNSPIRFLWAEYVVGRCASGGTVDVSALPLLRVTWPVLGLDETLTVSFQTTVGTLPAGTQIRNDAYLTWSTLPGDVTTPQSTFNSLSTERVYDPPINANVIVVIPSLPATGFAPDRVTVLPPVPAGRPYADLGGMLLDIPALQLSLPIVGVPADPVGWDLTWLADQAGYLVGTAYPTHRGNSALTAHVTLPDGRPGPFMHWATCTGRPRRRARLRAALRSIRSVPSPA
jgi:hypothetical protein